MRTFSLALPLLAALVAAADIDNVLAALSTLNNDLIKLNTDVSNVQGGIFGISSCLQASLSTTQVDTDIIAVGTAVTNSAKFSASDSQRIISSVDTITKQSNTTITNTISKQPSFAGLSPVVLSALYQLKQDSGNLGFALAFKLDQSAINQGVQDLTALNSGFDQAIAVYAAA